MGGVAAERAEREAALFARFRELVEACGPSELAPRTSITYWKRARVFAGAWTERGRLELNVDLLREADHPTKLVAFHHTQRVITHRLRVTEPEQLDDALAALLQEAYDTVGPGTRKAVQRGHI